MELKSWKAQRSGQRGGERHGQAKNRVTLPADTDGRATESGKTSFQTFFSREKGEPDGYSIHEDGAK